MAPRFCRGRLPPRQSQPLLDESVGFAGQILFLSLKTQALVLCVVRDGQTSIQAFGHRADNASEPPSADTLFRIGSVTKTFTGQVLASLAGDTRPSRNELLPVDRGGRPPRVQGRN